MSDGRGLPIRLPLYKVGDWLSDNAWFAHRTVPLFNTFYDYLPPRDGTYQLHGNGPTRRNTTVGISGLLDRLHAGTLRPARIVEQAPAQLVDIDKAGEIMAYQEPWYVEHPEVASKSITFDGRIAQPTTLALNGTAAIDGWHLTPTGGGSWVLVGTHDGERRFYLAALRGERDLP